MTPAAARSTIHPMTLPRATVTADLIDLRRRLVWYRANATSAHLPAVRADHDALVCLGEEAGEAKAATIARLLERYEALMARLVN